MQLHVVLIGVMEKGLQWVSAQVFDHYFPLESSLMHKTVYFSCTSLLV